MAKDYLSPTGLSRFKEKLVALIPTTLAALTGDSTHRTVTDAEKTTWNGKANGTHTHTKSQITDFPTIPTVPSSLPANGGNSDTVDGYHIVVSSSPPAAGTANNVITFVV